MSFYAHFYSAVQTDVSTGCGPKDYVWVFHSQRNIKLFLYSVNLHYLWKCAHHSVTIYREKMCSEFFAHQVCIQSYVKPALIMNRVKVAIENSFTEPDLNQVSLFI
jgi:hypothetical protein